MAHHGQAQMVRPDPLAEDHELPGFDPQFITRNGITSIVGIPSVKRVNKPILEEAHRYLYRFDEQGRTIYTNTSFGNPGSGSDTASIVTTYDEEGRVVNRLFKELSGQFSLELHYDSLDRIVRSTYIRLHDRRSARIPEPDSGITIISDEHIRHERWNDTTTMRLYLNADERPYRKQVITTNKDGYVLSIEDGYVISGRRSRTSFTYQERGWLHERTTKIDGDASGPSRLVHSYDVAGNLLASDLYRGDVHTRHDEYLYDDRTMYLKARLSKNMETGMINIIKYTVVR
ncbi:MAG: hypothetical protein KDB88_14265 [Flavobacteriales bacterium]|nr:hypothetical protein [Flavobacteriales bacterium]